jgi:hypothetical protein
LEKLCNTLITNYQRTYVLLGTYTPGSITTSSHNNNNTFNTALPIVVDKACLWQCNQDDVIVVIAAHY